MSEKPPKKLFKYCDANGLLVLKNIEVKVTPPDEFNDPFELHPKLNITFSDKFLNKLRNSFASKRYLKGDLLVHLQVMWERRKRHIINFVNSPESEEGLKNDLSSKFCLLCLSSHPDNLLMWGHYADKHKGLVIGFDSEHLWPKLQIHEVKYHSDRKRPICLGSYDDDGKLSYAEDVTLALRTKAVDWQYENEFRILIERKDCTEKYSTTDKKHLYVRKIDPKSIAQVVIGFKSNLESEIRAALDKPELRHVRLFKAKKNPDFFKVDLEELHR